MRIRHSLILGVAAVGLAIGSPVMAQDSTQVGTLTCNVAPGVGLIVGSSKSLDCLFRSTKGTRDVYAGTINRLGIDIGATTGGRLVWQVFAPTNRFPRGALAGQYVGASGEATVGAGAGANVLVGGNNNTFSLQPLSVQGQTGVSLAAGVASITLQPVMATGTTTRRTTIIEERRR
jgi:hypothetical protein